MTCPAKDCLNGCGGARADCPANAGAPIEPHAGGRPTLYRPEFAEQATKLCRLGATDSDLADFFGVDVRTLYRWQLVHDEFCQALVVGKDAPDERVKRSLYARAVGYSYDAVKIFMPAGAEAPVYAPYREHVPPSEGAAMSWLKNRRPDEWREKVTQELTGPGGGPINLTWFDGST